MDHIMMTRAVEFMRRNVWAEGTDRMTLVNECLRFLLSQEDFHLSDESARRISAKALGEVERNFHTLDVDIDASTSHTIFIRSHGDGQCYAFTTSMLLKIMRSHAIPIT